MAGFLEKIKDWHLAMIKTLTTLSHSSYCANLFGSSVFYSLNKSTREIMWPPAAGSRCRPSTLSLAVANAVCYSRPAFLTSRHLVRCSLSVDLSRRLDAGVHQSLEPLNRRLLEPLIHPAPRTSQSTPQNSRLTTAARRLLGATYPTVARYLSGWLLGISVDAGGHQFYVYCASGESMEEFLKVPCILHMVSIRGSHTALKDLFQRKLRSEMVMT
ncbi:hypothetical protein Cgig2_001603 [Carnegiea gigantea]|uniref:Uncharacterized protein n=1 Tax=Carnegiea gigantea TaxID=171969 RepID=A0A9Q1KCC8_9CARY|nr:hypothetical protein Cgig2_001603 [Carnegiea gigantea]